MLDYLQPDVVVLNLLLFLNLPARYYISEVTTSLIDNVLLDLIFFLLGFLIHSSSISLFTRNFPPNFAIGNKKAIFFLLLLLYQIPMHPSHCFETNQNDHASKYGGILDDLRKRYPAEEAHELNRKRR